MADNIKLLNESIQEIEKIALWGMKSLGIAIRDGHKNDTKHVHLVEKHSEKGFNAKLIITAKNKEEVINADDPYSMSYPGSLIAVSTEVMNILKSPFDKNSFNHIKARSIVAHELVHYYQIGTFEELHGKDYIVYDSSNYNNYLNQRCELEAHAVQGFYYLLHTNENELDRLIDNSDTNNVKASSLVQIYLAANNQSALNNQ